MNSIAAKATSDLRRSPAANLLAAVSHRTFIVRREDGTSAAAAFSNGSRPSYHDLRIPCDSESSRVKAKPESGRRSRQRLGRRQGES